MRGNRDVEELTLSTFSEVSYAQFAALVLSGPKRLALDQLGLLPDYDTQVCDDQSCWTSCRVEELTMSPCSFEAEDFRFFAKVLPKLPSMKWLFWDLSGSDFDAPLSTPVLLEAILSLESRVKVSLEMKEFHVDMPTLCQLLESNKSLWRLRLFLDDDRHCSQDYSCLADVLKNRNTTLTSFELAPACVACPQRETFSIIQYYSNLNSYSRRSVRRPDAVVTELIDMLLLVWTRNFEEALSKNMKESLVYGLTRERPDLWIDAIRGQLATPLF